MLHTHSYIIDAIKTIAYALGDLNEQVVYVGGAVIGMYVDETGAPEMRPTKDVDIVFEIATMYQLEKVRQKLEKCGIHFSHEENILCRFKYQHILLDVMSTQEVGWAPANPWFKEGFSKSFVQNIEDISVRIMPLPYFLASKFSAFQSRGTDPRTSHDFEDVVYLLDNSSMWEDKIKEADEKVKAFLVKELDQIIHNLLLQEAVLAHLEPETQTARYDLLVQRVMNLVQ